jgi:hypothetical protein
MAVWVAPCKCVVTGMKLVNAATITGHTANYGTLTVYNKGTAGAGTTVVAARSTNVATTNDVTSYVPWVVTLSTTAASLEVASGELLSAKFIEAGNGQDLTKAHLVIQYVPGTGAGQ